MRGIVPWTLVLLAGCASGTSSSSSGTSSADGGRCDTIAEEIRQAAIKRGYDGDGDGIPDAKGVCESTNATIQTDFAKACADLKACGG